ncbi:hypothetical protein NST62_00395 [Ureibacillus sp. FSL K6-8385]|uniref:Uncharacterized protein n=1 Tax=Ureibacillus terrenus TaxID=118246 RepID=A0A540V5A1_9BACL|nr:hypothetical protein [Ureibacillus terrenus]TQE91929.1 hypothetical protein FKZ59_02215 [Ureibacillus terrenus]
MGSTIDLSIVANGQLYNLVFLNRPRMGGFRLLMLASGMPRMGGNPESGYSLKMGSFSRDIHFGSMRQMSREPSVFHLLRKSSVA